MKKWIWVLFLLSHAFCLNGQVIIEGHGELYVLHLQDGGVRIIAATVGGEIEDTIFTELPDDLILHYFSADSLTDVDFRFTLHPAQTAKQDQPLPEKTLVVSDLHGRLDAFIALLKNNEVVDENLEWRYGGNRLIFIGDILDRGRDDNGIAWLVYKLQRQAEQAGGRVDFLPGNHEDLVMRGDYRYVHPAHIEFADKAGIPYRDLYGTESEIGRWFRASPLIIVSDDILFVHAGLSRQMADSLYSITEMNRLYSRYAGIPSDERRSAEPRCNLLFGSSGPLWYRGLVFDSKKYPAAQSCDLDATLEYYNVSHIIVGHSEIDEVESRYDGRVIAVNVKHGRNFSKNRSGALLIENKAFYAVDYEGVRHFLYGR